MALNDSCNASLQIHSATIKENINFLFLIPTLTPWHNSHNEILSDFWTRGCSFIMVFYIFENNTYGSNKLVEKKEISMLYQFCKQLPVTKMCISCFQFIIPENTSEISLLEWPGRCLLSRSSWWVYSLSMAPCTAFLVIYSYSQE